MQPFLRYMACMHPECRSASGPPELQTRRLRERGFDALVVDLRSVTPADDLLIEDLGQMRGGFICRVGHPLTKFNTPITFAHLQRYPLASTSLNPELASSDHPLWARS
jgi:DNA-binding transcriptional LysR family regulator